MLFLCLLILALFVISVGVFLRLEYLICCPDPRQGKVLILTYHDLTEDECHNHKNIYFTKRKDFIKQMLYLKRNKYRIISLFDLIEGANTNKMPEKAAIITFDGPYRNWISIACPILIELGFKATFFPRLDWIEKSGDLTWGDLVAIKNFSDSSGEKLFDVQSHTVNHTLLKPSAGENGEEFVGRLEFELLESKKYLDVRLGQETRFLALPYGEGDSRMVLDVAWKSGYYGLRTTAKSGLLNYLPAAELILVSQYSDNALGSFYQFLYAAGKYRRGVINNYLFWMITTMLRTAKIIGGRRRLART